MIDLDALNARAIGFTGTQQGMSHAQDTNLQWLLSRLDVVHGTTFHHGDCIGADAQAHVLARAMHLHIVIHPPIIQTKRAFMQADEERMPAAYLDRNHQIVAATQILIATPSSPTEELRSGTWATVRYARKLGKRIYILNPDGTLQIEKARDG